MNIALSYELVVQSIFQEIVDQNFADTIKVRHDVTMKGRTTRHQIDVLWRFSVGGIKYTTIVQAKNWTKPISKSAVLAFREVLNDLPHQPRGVIVTKTGFQSGAKSLANKYGIKLFLLRQSIPKVAITDIGYATFALDAARRVYKVTVYRPVVEASFTFMPPAHTHP